MNREIKFRIYDTDTKEMMYHDLLDIMIGSHSSLLLAEDLELIPAAKIMQYTGLKDKNDKEIYEGDIVTYQDMHPIFGGPMGKPRISPVDYLGSAFQVKSLEYSSGQSYHTLSDVVETEGTNLEILGNIYENPELLKGGKNNA